MTDIELWLKQDGKIEQITNHEAFSEKIKKRPFTQYNVLILRAGQVIIYSIYWSSVSDVFDYSAMHVKTSQLDKALAVAKLLQMTNNNA